MAVLERPTANGESVTSLKRDPEFMAGVKRGLLALKQGEMLPWSEVKAELGIK